MAPNILALLRETEGLWKPRFDDKARRALVKAAKKLDLVADFSYLADRGKEKSGYEHDVWIERNPQPGDRVARVYKATRKTKSGGFGYLVADPRQPAKPYAHATAIDYLRRLLLLNCVFTDFIRLEGVWIPKRGGQARIVTSQKFVAEAKRYRELPREDVDREADDMIRDHLKAHGFSQPVGGEDLGMWTRQENSGRTIVLADIYPRNVILTEEGHPAIIDALAQMY